MRWDRLAAVVASAVLGIGGAVVILGSASSPRWLIAVSGLLALGGGLAVLALVAFAWYIIEEDVRPRLRFGKPGARVSVSIRQASLHGRRSYKHYPVKFWGGLLLNNSFLFGLMAFEKPEIETYRVDDAAS